MKYSESGYNCMSKAPLDDAVRHANPHHCIVGVQSSLLVDAAGNPWNGLRVYAHGNLIVDLLDNLVLELTGVLQRTNIYKMSCNHTLGKHLPF